MNYNSIFIKFASSEPGEPIEIKVGADGKPWRKVFLSMDEIRGGDFWRILAERTQAAWIDPNETSNYQCPSCGTSRKTFLRGHGGGRYFCGFCGAHLRIEGGRLIAVRTIDELKR